VRDLVAAVGVLPRRSSRRSAARDLGLPLGSVRRSGRSAARRSRLPGRSSLRNSWLLAPPGPASTSWTQPVSVLGRPESLPRTTRSLGPGRPTGMHGLNVAVRIAGYHLFDSP
jgi:hypothetical protein